MDTHQLKNDSINKAYFYCLEEGSFRRKIKTKTISTNYQIDSKKCLRQIELKSLIPCNSFRSKKIEQRQILCKSYSFKTNMKQLKNINENPEKIKKFRFLYKQYLGKSPNYQNQKFKINAKAANSSSKKFKIYNYSKKDLKIKIYDNFSNKIFNKNQKMDQIEKSTSKESNNGIINTKKGISLCIQNLNKNAKDIQQIINFTPTKFY